MVLIGHKIIERVPCSFPFPLIEIDNHRLAGPGKAFQSLRVEM